MTKFSILARERGKPFFFPLPFHISKSLFGFFFIYVLAVLAIVQSALSLFFFLRSWRKSKQLPEVLLKKKKKRRPNRRRSDLSSISWGRGGCRASLK